MYARIISQSSGSGVSAFVLSLPFPWKCDPEVLDDALVRTHPSEFACEPATTLNPDLAGGELDPEADEDVALIDCMECDGVTGLDDGLNISDDDGVVKDVEADIVGEVERREEPEPFAVVGVVRPLPVRGMLSEDLGDRGRVGLEATSLLDRECFDVGLSS